MNETELVVEIYEELHIVTARGRIRKLVMDHLSMGLTERTQIVTVVSELARNIYNYAGSGKIRAAIIQSPQGKKGIQINFQDQGPGIKDVAEAMKPKSLDQYSHGMGIGLSGSVKMADEYNIQSEPGKGTDITWIKWERK